MRIAAPALAAVLLAGCFTYVRPSSPEPQPGTRVALELNDRGRLSLAPTLGPGVDRIEGTLIGYTDSAYALRVAEVKSIRGERTRWTGERYEVPAAYVGVVRERKLARRRTAVMGGALLAAVGTFVLTRTVDGGGVGGNDPGGGQPPGAAARVPAP